VHLRGISGELNGEQEAAEQPEVQTAEQPELDTVEEPEEQIVMVAEVQQGVLHHHGIHHHLIMGAPGVRECPNDKGELRNCNSPNQSKLNNLKSFTEMPEKTLLPGGNWYKSILKISRRNFQRMNKRSTG